MNVFFGERSICMEQSPATQKPADTERVLAENARLQQQILLYTIFIKWWGLTDKSR